MRASSGMVVNVHPGSPSVLMVLTSNQLLRRNYGWTAPFTEQYVEISHLATLGVMVRFVVMMMLDVGLGESPAGSRQAELMSLGLGLGCPSLALGF